METTSIIKLYEIDSTGERKLLGLTEISVDYYEVDDSNVAKLTKDGENELSDWGIEDFNYEIEILDKEHALGELEILYSKERELSKKILMLEDWLGY